MNDEVRRITEKNILLEIQLEEERTEKNIYMATMVATGIALFLVMAFPGLLQ